MALRGSLSGPSRSFVADFRRRAEQRFESAVLKASDEMAKEAISQVRSEMKTAGLGNLGNAIGYGSDLRKGNRAHRIPGGFSASGWLFIRSGSERSRGALDVYLGSGSTTITPKKGRYLWFPTDEIQRLVGKGSRRRRVTPALYRSEGLEKRIGPLVSIKDANGTPLLIVRNVGVNAGGKARSARSLTKKGTARKGDVAVDFIIAFVGIPYTSRQARVDVAKIVRSIMAKSRGYISAALGRL